MLGGACDEQFLDVYRRSHDPPEGGGRGACLRDAGRRPWGCRARRRGLARWTVGGHRDQGRQAGDRFDERVSHHPLTVYVFSTPVLCAPSGALSFGLPGRAARTVLRCGTRDTLGKNFRHRGRGTAHSSNWDSGGAGLRGAAAEGSGTPIWRISSTGCSIGGTRSGANIQAASSAATAATTSVIRIANARHRLIRRCTAAVAGAITEIRASLGASSAAAAGGTTGAGETGSTAGICAGVASGLGAAATSEIGSDVASEAGTGVASEVGAAEVASETGAAVTSKAGAGVASEAGAGVTSKAGAAVTSKAGAGVASEAGAGVTSEAGAGVTSEAGAGVTSEAGAGVTSEAGAGVTSEAGAGVASEAGAGVASEAGIWFPSG